MILLRCEVSASMRTKACEIESGGENLPIDEWNFGEQFADEVVPEAVHMLTLHLQGYGNSYSYAQGCSDYDDPTEHKNINVLETRTHDTGTYRTRRDGLDHDGIRLKITSHRILPPHTFRVETEVEWFGL